MEFGGDIGLWQRRAGTSPEGDARRLAVFEALTPRPGDHMLDVGWAAGIWCARWRLRSARRAARSAST